MLLFSRRLDVSVFGIDPWDLSYPPFLSFSRSRSKINRSSLKERLQPLPSRPCVPESFCNERASFGRELDPAHAPVIGVRFRLRRADARRQWHACRWASLDSV